MGDRLKIFDHVPSQYTIDMPDDQTQLPFIIRFGDLDLQKYKNRTILSKGDFTSLDWCPHDDPSNKIVSLKFEIQILKDENGRNYIQRTKTPVYYTEDGDAVSAASSKRAYFGADYNSWSKAARARTYEDLTEWVPASMIYTGVVASVEEAQVTAATWLFGTMYDHYTMFQRYVDTGDAGKSVFLSGLNQELADGVTPWLSNIVPDGVVPGLPTGSSIHEMIRLALR